MVTPLGHLEVLHQGAESGHHQSEREERTTHGSGHCNRRDSAGTIAMKPTCAHIACSSSLNEK